MKIKSLMIILCIKQDIKEVFMNDIRLVSTTEQKRPPYDFNKMRIGGTTYRDEVTLDIKKVNERRARKEDLRMR